MAYENVGGSMVEWCYMDIACSNHLTRNKQWLVDFDFSKRTKINCVNDENMNAKGMENVKVKLNNGKTALIKDVWYVSGMNSNLMSVGQLIEKGFSVTMKDNLLKLYDCNKKLIMQYELGGSKTFKVNVPITDTQCFSARNVEGESELWHKRSGHLHYKSLGNVSSKTLVHGIPKIVAPEKSCDVCMKGKQPRWSFSSEMPPRATHVLGMVHYDVCGPFKVP